MQLFKHIDVSKMCNAAVVNNLVEYEARLNHVRSTYDCIQSEKEIAYGCLYASGVRGRAGGARS
jgi:hypothetical protein